MNIDVVEVSPAWVWRIGHAQVQQAVLPGRHHHCYDHNLWDNDDDDDDDDLHPIREKMIIPAIISDNDDFHLIWERVDRSVRASSSWSNLFSHLDQHHQIFIQALIFVEILFATKHVGIRTLGSIQKNNAPLFWEPLFNLFSSSGIILQIRSWQKFWCFVTILTNFSRIKQPRPKTNLDWWTPSSSVCLMEKQTKWQIYLQWCGPGCQCLPSGSIVSNQTDSLSSTGWKLWKCNKNKILDIAAVKTLTFVSVASTFHNFKNITSITSWAAHVAKRKRKEEC